MTKFTLILLFLVAVARAEIPLELMEEIQLPVGTTAWDVQHWMDDSTYGMAWVVGDTIYYRENQNSATAVLNILDAVPDTLYEDENDGPMYHRTLRLCRSAVFPDHPMVIVITSNVWQGGDFNSDDFVYRIDLTTNSVNGSYGMYSSEFHNYLGSNYSVSISTPTAVALWPPAPDASELLFYGLHSTYSAYIMGGIYTDSYGSGGRLYRLESNGSLLGQFGVEKISMNVSVSQFDAAIAGSYYYHSETENGVVLEHVTRSKMQVLSDLVANDPDTTCASYLPPSDLFCGGPFAALRTIENSWKFVTENENIVCFNEDHNILWEVDRETSDLRRIRLPEYQNDVLLSKISGLNSYEILSGEDGSLLHSVSEFEGQLQYIIERQGFTPEFVTYVDSSDIVRVYRLLPALSSDELDISVPHSFGISSVYPNPFNPVTTIQFSLTQNSLVELSIYNLLGQKTATLVTENLSAGVHESSWNAESNSSGIYFAKLETMNQTSVRKLVVMK